MSINPTSPALQQALYQVPVAPAVQDATTVVPQTVPQSQTNFAGAPQYAPAQEEKKSIFSLRNMALATAATVLLVAGGKTYKATSLFKELNVNKAGIEVAKAADGKATDKIISETHKLPVWDTFKGNLNPLNWFKNVDDKVISEAAKDYKQVGKANTLYSKDGDLFFRDQDRFVKLQNIEKEGAKETANVAKNATDEVKTPDVTPDAAVAKAEAKPVTSQALSPKQVKLCERYDQLSKKATKLQDDINSGNIAPERLPYYREELDKVQGEIATNQKMKEAVKQRKLINENNQNSSLNPFQKKLEARKEAAKIKSLSNEAAQESLKKAKSEIQDTVFDGQKISKVKTEATNSKRMTKLQEIESTTKEKLKGIADQNSPEALYLKDKLTVIDQAYLTLLSARNEKESKKILELTMKRNMASTYATAK